MKQLLKDPSFSGVSNGSKATVQLPTGWTYHQINIVARKANGVLMSAAEIAAGVGAISVKKDGVAFIESVPASVMRDIFGYYYNVNSQSAGANKDGIIPLPMSMPKFSTPFERDIFSIGTADVSSLSVEAQITSAVPVTLEVLSVKERVARPFGTHLAIRPYNDSFAGTGIFETSKMPKDTLGAAYRAIHIYNANIDDATIFVNNERIFEEVPANLNTLRQIERGRTPITSTYTIDMGLDDIPAAVLPLPIDDFRLRLNFSVAPNAFVIYNTFIEDMPAARK